MNMLVLLMTCVAALPALSADNVGIKVIGRTIAALCVFNGGNSDMNVNLGNIQAMNMLAPGLSSNPVSFNLLFTNCPLDTLSVTTRSSRTPNLEAGMNYHQNSGTATRATITTPDATTGVLMGNRSSITQNIATDRTVGMPMKAMVTPVTGRPTPSSIRAVIVLTMQYNRLAAGYRGSYVRQSFSSSGN